jgi:hypothetical protein
MKKMRSGHQKEKADARLSGFHGVIYVLDGLSPVAFYFCTALIMLPGAPLCIAALVWWAKAAEF